MNLKKAQNKWLGLVIIDAKFRCNINTFRVNRMLRLHYTTVAQLKKTVAELKDESPSQVTGPCDWLEDLIVVLDAWNCGGTGDGEQCVTTTGTSGMLMLRVPNSAAVMLSVLRARAAPSPLVEDQCIWTTWTVPAAKTTCGPVLLQKMSPTADTKRTLVSHAQVTAKNK